MELEAEVLERVGTWESLSRWEKSELGKDLRHLGLSYGEIMELIPVKKSTLAAWCRDVRLTTDQIEAIRQRRAQEPGIPRDTNWRRREEIEQLRSIARELALELADDPFWIAGSCPLLGRRNKGSKPRQHGEHRPTGAETLRQLADDLHRPDRSVLAEIASSRGER